MSSPHYRIVDHTADIGFEIKGSTKKQVFETAALAFFDIMWSIKSKKEVKPITINVTGNDLKELLVNFLEEFLYFYDAKGFICTALKVTTLTDTSIRAMVWLQQFDEKTDQEIMGVKAVTYHQLYIDRKDHAWSARIFLDV